MLGNPNMQRVMEDTSYAASIEIYLERCRGDVWTLEMKDRNQRDIELFAPFRNDLKKKICVGAVSHRTLQADRAEDVAGEIRNALVHIPVEQLIVSSDCGFGRQGCNREIAFYKASAIAQGCNIVRGGLSCRRPTSRRPTRSCRLTSWRGRGDSYGAAVSRRQSVMVAEPPPMAGRCIQSTCHEAVIGRDTVTPAAPSRRPENVCWGCNRYCPANDLGCGNGSIRTPHPAELLGDDWAEWSRMAPVDRPRPDPKP